MLCENMYAMVEKETRFIRSASLNKLTLSIWNDVIMKMQKKNDTPLGIPLDKTQVFFLLKGTLATKFPIIAR